MYLMLIAFICMGAGIAREDLVGGDGMEKSCRIYKHEMTSLGPPGVCTYQASITGDWTTYDHPNSPLNKNK